LELARAKVTDNRVAVVVANEWKDTINRVMPVKKWIEEQMVTQVGCLSCFVIKDI
jgi:hypothetical protein